MREVNVTCCIVGGGPAGMMLGLLLARAGVEVTVLEKHADFLRDFRGDTIHPSTLQVMQELGLLEDFLKLPHQKARELDANIGGLQFSAADFSHLPVAAPYIAFMPQWDFLNFLAEHGAQYPTFKLCMNAEATRLLRDDTARVTGVMAQTPEGELIVRSDLVVGADGRGSVVREQAGLYVRELGAPMDVLWFRLSRQNSDPNKTMGLFESGQAFILIDRGSHWQCGLVIAKGAWESIQSKGLPAFRENIGHSVPFLKNRVDELATWEDIKLLTVRLDRLKRWYQKGLLCIGDAAHAMSPVGGVGVNLAIQDAVATANILAKPLREKHLRLDDLAAVQRRRLLPTRVTQKAQLLIQNRVISAVLDSSRALKVPLPARMIRKFPRLRRIPGRLIGLGIRPEHVETPSVFY